MCHCYLGTDMGKGATCATQSHGDIWELRKNQSNILKIDRYLHLKELADFIISK